MSQAFAIDIHALIVHRSVGRLQQWVLFFGFCIITLEGFDLTVMGFIAPALRQQWHVSNHALGPVLSVAQVGLLLGALAAGPLADRFGRKSVLLISMAVFGLGTLLTATASDLPHLIVFRFLTGFGVGSVLPNTATLVSEYMPERIRSLSVSLIICGVAFSAACAGFLSAWMMPRFGWQSVLIPGGILPLLMIPVLFFKLPESIRFLVNQQAPATRIRAIVDQLAPGVANRKSTFVTTAEPAKRGATRTVFSAPYRFGGLMLWIACFAALFASNMLSSWLPTLIRESGYSLSHAAFIAGVYQLGGVAGSLFLGWGMDRYNLHKVPSLACLVSGVLFFGWGATCHSPSLLVLQAFALGFCLIGAISGINALSAAFYPTEARATGSCWMHGAGRSGALLSILAGAQMLTLGWSAAEVFTALAAPAAIAGIALLVKAYRQH